jgi:hypothetical protein
LLTNKQAWSEAVEERCTKPKISAEISAGSVSMLAMTLEWLMSEQEEGTKEQSKDDIYSGQGKFLSYCVGR